MTVSPRARSLTTEQRVAIAGTWYNTAYSVGCALGAPACGVWVLPSMCVAMTPQCVTAAIWLTVRTHIGVACMVHIMGSVYSYLRRVPAMERTCFSLRSPKH